MLSFVSLADEIPEPDQLVRQLAASWRYTTHLRPPATLSTSVYDQIVSFWRDAQRPNALSELLQRARSRMRLAAAGHHAAIQEALEIVPPTWQCETELFRDYLVENLALD
jgi:hypothetical protein